MLEHIQEKISVITKYDKTTNSVMPVKIRWQGRDYMMKKLAYYHKIRQGRVIQHIFHVTDGNLDFRLRMDSDLLSWTLEEVTDGTPT
ncbi:hypothetical protein COY87_03780 [Candidatus Roizmanbacteria bacterium CG_4_10_14_0_8_um_filter_33_9]|uniref:Uncharacterized protein n=1 Tax=Candidatus Roizmanbacteria bacterium CG_4_10_14_0_8_um_filter_33_9 TaxID=1974826 RepID=A0A2M7QIU9_9BACT|nr:MAG: hypothetical protein COY87_03780 [Candidatus Roizmanbacteria bacterium CG_4_10_14_0_8_um_filter_33_9]